MTGVPLIVASCGNDRASDAPAAEGGAGDAALPGKAGTGPSDAASDAAVDVEASVPLVDTCFAEAGAVPTAWTSDPHLCLTVYAEAITGARQMAFAPNGDMFVEAGGTVVALVDANGDHVVSAAETFMFEGESLGLTGGVAIDPSGAFVYASSATTILRWPYKAGDHIASAVSEVVVRDMPDQGHFSRTLVFDAQSRLHVNVGSEGDVDTDPTLNATRAQVRRFTLPGAIPAGGIAYSAGEVFAYGLRNEVGLAFDSKGRMWGVENGSDGTYMPSVGQDNPAEEINRLDAPGVHFFGYPDCWTEYGFDGGGGKGTQWAYLTPDAKTDAFCRNPANVQPPAGAMPGHWAALGVTEVSGGSLPWPGDLLVTAHGSYYRDPAVGRLVAHAHLVGDKVASVEPIVGHLVDGGLEQGTWDARPVDIRMGPDHAAYFSDDYSSRIFRLGYRP